MKIRLIKISLIALVSLSLVFLIFPLNQAKGEITEEPLFTEPELPLGPSIPGRTEGAGTYFEIKDSEYLNITLKSTEEIQIILESIQRMISLNIEAAPVNSTNLTLEGLEPNKTYYKYQDSYKNGAVFISDETGSYSWQQDLFQPHHIWLQEIGGTMFIDRDTVLASDLNESVEIIADNITLDCNGHNITGDGTNFGIYLNNKEDVTIKNCIVSNFSYGIYVKELSNSTISDNNINLSKERGISLLSSRSNNIINNIISSNARGVVLDEGSKNNTIAKNNIESNFYGIVTLLLGNDYNMISNNNIVHSSGYGILLYSSNTTVIENNIRLGNWSAIRISYGSHNIISSNNLNTNAGDGITLGGSSYNNVEKNTIVSNGQAGICLWFSSTNNIINENTILNNVYGIYLRNSSNNNKIYHNNFTDNESQTYIIDSFANLFDNNYPSGGNFWSDYSGVDEKSGPNQDQSGLDGIGDTPYSFTGGQDNYPFMRENGWEAPPPEENQPPTISNLGQFKSDGLISISEGDTTTESTVVFKATLNDPENDQVKLQIELKEFNQSFNEQDLLESDFISSGSEAIITKYGLIDGQYHWRARAIDIKGASSDWQEFGEAGNVDFKVKLVPLYTQIISPYPSWSETDSWDHLIYARGDIEYYKCGKTIAQCGCALTSGVMVLRYYDVINVNQEDVNPETVNAWLKNNKGYQAGAVNWLKIAEYSSYKIKYDIAKSGNYFNNYTLLDEYLNKNQPVITKEINPDHFIVIDNKLATAYGVKDSSWYNTKKLDELTTDWESKIRDYNNNFYGLRLYYPGDGIAMSAISLTLASPAEILLTDPSGRKLGKDPILGVEYDEIPEGSYFTESIDNPTGELPPSGEENKVIYIGNPLNDNYNVEIIGTGAGSYTLNLLVYDQNGQSKEDILEGSTTINNIQNFELTYSNQTIQQTEIYRIVNSDIKPGSYPNSINLKSEGIIPAAVLTDNFFNAKDIVIDSIVFAGAAPLRGNFEDVDNDGDLDLILHFDTQSLNLTSSDTEATLFGKLNNGTLIKGVDSIRVVSK